MTTLSIDITIIALVAILIIAQLCLSINQIRQKAGDGKILLAINLCMTIIWIPLCIFKMKLQLHGLNIAWFAVAAIYMIFTIWYTKMLGRSLQNPPKK